MTAAWFLLVIAIIVEVTATTLLPRTQAFTAPIWTSVVVIAYGISFWLLALIVRTLPVSVAYAVWSSAGTAIVAVVGVYALGEPMSWIKAASLAAILLGVIGLNLADSH